MPSKQQKAGPLPVVTVQFGHEDEAGRYASALRRAGLPSERHGHSLLVKCGEMTAEQVSQLLADTLTTCGLDSVVVEIGSRRFLLGTAADASGASSLLRGLAAPRRRGQAQVSRRDRRG